MFVFINLFGSAGWQELQVVTLIARNTPRQEDGVGVCVINDKLLAVLCVLVTDGIGWQSLRVPMNPAVQAKRYKMVLQGLKFKLPYKYKGWPVFQLSSSISILILIIFFYFFTDSMQGKKCCPTDLLS